MAPAADMFEMGVNVQVLKRGTMFAMRGPRSSTNSIGTIRAAIDRIPPADRAMLGRKTIFKAPLETIWDQTRAYFLERDPAQVERALRDSKHLMALVFRWYLGQSSHWANAGELSRIIDYQVWCGPAMAAFNEWVRGSFLERPEQRRVATVAMNILYNASVLTRARTLAAQGVPRSAVGIPRLRPAHPGGNRGTDCPIGLKGDVPVGQDLPCREPGRNARFLASPASVPRIAAFEELTFDSARSNCPRSPW